MTTDIDVQSAEFVSFTLALFNAVGDISPREAGDAWLKEWKKLEAAVRAGGVPPDLTWKPTLQQLAQHLGWGNKMTDDGIFAFVVERERLLRGAMALLETQKSGAATAEDAIRDRIETLRAGSVRQHFHDDSCYAIGPGDTEALICKWRAEGGMFGRKEAAAELAAVRAGGVSKK